VIDTRWQEIRIEYLILDGKTLELDIARLGPDVEGLSPAPGKMKMRLPWGNGVFFSGEKPPRARG
jgi:hypothetical protein